MRRADKVRTLRVAKRWEQSHLAEAVDRGSGAFASASYVCKLEKGAADTAKVTVLEALADALEVPREVLLTQIHDDEISKDAEDFVIRHSLQLFAAASALSAEDTGAFRTTYKRLRKGPRDVEGWTVALAYAQALLTAGIKKPGVRAPSRTAVRTDRQARRTR